jgi:hypothetical protein
MENYKTGNALIDYVRDHAAIIQGTPPEGSMAIADTMFIKVAIDRTNGEPNKDELEALIKANKGEFCEIDLFDGKEHSYIEIGGWIGDQTDALLLMGLGNLLGLFKLLPPNNLMPFLPQAMRDQMAGMGMVSVMASSPE